MTFHKNRIARIEWYRINYSNEEYENQFEILNLFLLKKY